MKPELHFDSAEADATSGDFLAALFRRAAPEDLQAYDQPARSAFAERAWRHLAEPRLPGRADIRLYETAGPPLKRVTVLEIVNDDMPFLLDTALAELDELGFELRLVAHPVLAVERDERGGLRRVWLDPESAPVHAARESLIHIHLEPIVSEERREALERALEADFGEVRRAVDDRAAMLARVDSAISSLRADPPALATDEIAEAVQFLRWLLADNFVFLGQRLYAFEESRDGEPPLFAAIADSGLGILRDLNVRVLRRGREWVLATPEVFEFMRDEHVLIVTKANVKSRVRRHVHLDYIGVKRFDASGRPIGELRILGLFTASAYTQSTQSIPYIRHKVARVLERAHLDLNSHSGRLLVATLEGYPRDELFQIDLSTLARFATEIAALQDRPRLRILARLDRFDRFVSVLAFLPRDRFGTPVQVRLGEELARIYEGRVSATYPSFPDGPLVRIHYIIGRYEGRTPDPPRELVEGAAAAVVRTWSDKLRAKLIEVHGAAGHALAERWASAFSAGYMESFDAAGALQDIASADGLSEAHPCAVSLHLGQAPHCVDFEVFSRGRPMPLSERVPVLEAMGFKVISERTFEIAPSSGSRIWLHDMALIAASGQSIDLEERGALIEDAALAVFAGTAESDGYNALTLEAGLDWRRIAALRTMSRYLRQVGVSWSQSYMWRTATRNAAIVRLLLDLLAAKFDPDLGLTADERAARQADLAVQIESLLRRVSSLDEDRILRRFLNLVQAAVRTNFFQRDSEGRPSPVIAFKFESGRIEDLPHPKPLYEITVCSPRVEGIHLRFGKVARGGLRWSDRPQDFRTEILGLAKAQQVKNAVIVPVGAKGGFVPKQLPPASRRDDYLAEGIAAYRLFVEALLDLTDNLVGEHVTAPAGVLRLDGDDPYLVVAADKGTASFSDIANSIAARHGFWLDDAFASGGSAGYDHKKIGITARGAWEAVKRHFRELDVNVRTTPFMAAGVGDMSGDVFGNGMLLSRAMKLVAAFDHRDIFIDPDPVPDRSFEERSRLFHLARSTWQDYDRSLISDGGGVYSRTGKSVGLSPQARALLGLDREQATPDEVIAAILKSPVDLLWFGGIGTYVRASDEGDEQVGDRANDAVRIDATQLRCKVIGEGANLGVTQRARVEASRRGVRMNTDAIDNSAGVNTSDIEVNIKIALSRPVREKTLDRISRDAMLAGMTDEVAALVLRNNYRQTLSISLTERRGAAEIPFAVRLMQQLEQQNRLERAVEFLPSDAALRQRASAEGGLTRPEIAVLLAYAKLSLNDDLLASQILDDPYLNRELALYFPSALRDRYPEALAQHRLKREIIATQLANAVINCCGPTVVARLADDVGARAPETARAFAAVRDAFSLDEISAEVDRLDDRISGAAQLALYAAIQELLLSRTAWFIRNVDFAAGIDSVVRRFKAGVQALGETLTRAAPLKLRRNLEARAAQLERSGAPSSLAQAIARLGALAAACDLVPVAEQAQRPIADIAGVFFALDETFRVSEISEAVRRLPAADHYERLALDRTVESFESSLRRLTANVVRSSASTQEAVPAWIAAHRAHVERIEAAMSAISGGPQSLSKAIVASGLLSELIED